MLPTVISSETWKYNFNDWNATQNTFNLKCYDDNTKFPQYLLIQGWEWFKDQCEVYHIDWSYYKWVTVTKSDVTWTLEFWDSPEMKNGNIGLYEIYYDSRNKKILQCIFGVN